MSSFGVFPFSGTNQIYWNQSYQATPGFPVVTTASSSGGGGPYVAPEPYVAPARELTDREWLNAELDRVWALAP
jgi:hypothetical protein